MSVVYEARHVKLQRQFAVKRLLSHLSDNEEAVQRFEREAEMLATLRHPNVVEVTDWDQFPDGTPCMVLEYLHGAPLQNRLARGPMAWDAVAKIADQTMSALTLAHRNGITHRDLKPDNIFLAIDDLGDERVKLLDFGISKLRGVNRATAVNAMLGTPAYMAPEQASGQTEQIGPPTDVWAMATILYEMATGRRAFPAVAIADVLMQILHGRPDPIPAFRNDAPRPFLELIERSLTIDVAQRIQTIEELRAGIREALDTRQQVRVVPALQPPTPRPASGPVPSVKPPQVGILKTPPPQSLPPPQVVVPKRKWLPLAIAGAVAVAITAGVLAFVLR